MTSNLDLLKNELDRLNAFSTPLPKFLLDLVDTIPNNRIDSKMKLTIVISEVILFASQFRRNILHWNNSLIPINAITFCISTSGTGKDSSINAMRKNFKSGYDEINHIRIEKAKDLAKSIARSKNLMNPEDPNVYEKFYDKPMPLFVAPSTNEGYIQYLNGLDSAGIGAGYLFSGEFGGELLTSSTIIQNLQLLAELYDEGKKEVKVLKDRDRQSQEIKNLPVSALFMGSPENILFDESVKKKFKTEFTTKLARRSFFNFNFFDLEEPIYNNVQELLNAEIKMEDYAKELNIFFDDAFKQVATIQIPNIGKPITVTPEARKLVILYKKYNAEVASRVNRQYPITNLVMMHLYWKALKLSGALALIQGRDEITAQDYKQAIGFTELLNEDMKNFEMELVKEPYELFASFCQSILQDNKCYIDVHTLKKMGYISNSTNISLKLKELATLASAYDTTGVYKVTDNGIEYTKLVKTNVSGISYLECSGDKEDRKVICSKNFKFAEIEFEHLGEMLKGDYAYSPFKFKDGIRSKKTIEGGIKWIALDIDQSDYTDEMIHEILADFNHHIARTSDPNNANKFRVLLELDSVVDLGDKEYKAFIASISSYLGLKADLLPKSQIYFSYADRNVLSVTDKYPLETREHIMRAYDSSNKTIQPEISKYSTEQKKALLADPLGTFHYAYEARNGEGSLCLFRAAKHAKELGASMDEVIDLVKDINNYWESPMPESRLENTLLKQIRGWSF